jgi:miniconductance mechanosensitive channel
MLDRIDPSNLLDNMFLSLGMSDNLAAALRTILIVLIVGLLSWLSFQVARLIIKKVVTVIVRRTKYKWDDIFLEAHVFTKLSHVAPALVIWFMADWALEAYPFWLSFVQKLTYLYMIIASLLVVYAFIDAWHRIYSELPISKHRHIKGYVQVFKIIFGFLAILVAISEVLNKEINVLLAGLGAMAAVLILVFKDTILGFVASVQLSSNKMVNIGDWISMPSKGADGTVIDITLNTVKIQNFDKTIITVPTYALVQDSFQNWVGMEESGGRRIKRALNIDMRTVGFLSDDQSSKLMKIQILKDYIINKEIELKSYNKEHGVDDSVLVNGRRLTNLGTFRAYIEAYLKNHPKILNDMTFLVRQLKPSEGGLPVEIYVFTSDQEWAKYEAIQADIFDHLLAVIPEFGLQVFQNPSGDDFRALINS